MIKDKHFGWMSITWSWHESIHGRSKSMYRVSSIWFIRCHQSLWNSSSRSLYLYSEEWGVV